MHSKYLQQFAFAASLLQTVRAQSEVVPEDLSGGFSSSGVDLQVSYTNEAVNGFEDGTTFETNEVSDTPSFALGDSSGIVASQLYTILMVDTTCDNVRTLHFAQANFKYNFEITNLESAANALQDYKAPGSFDEKGDDRKYSFLMYDNPGNDEISDLKLPDEGKAFDAKQFQEDNGFEDPVAGVGMVVKLGGTANCDGEPEDDGGDESSSAPAPAPASTSKVAASSAAASSAAASSAAESSAAESSAEATSAASSAARTTATASEASSRVSSPSTTTPEEPESTQADEPESTAAGDDGPSTSAEESAARTTDLVPATSALQSAPDSQPTGFSTSNIPSSSGTATGTGGPALQTDSGAAGLSLGTARCVVVASLIAFAGLLAF